MIAFLDLIDDEEDKKTFEQMYYRYRDLMMYVSMHRVHNQNDAEECVQEAFLYVAKNFDKIDDVNSSRTKCYLTTIVDGISITRFNKEKGNIFDHSEYIEELEIASDYFDSFEISDLKSAIDSIRDDYKNIIYLTYTFGYTSQEISNMLKISDTAVRKKLQYARKEIKIYLEGKMSNE